MLEQRCDICNGEGKIWLDYDSYSVSRPCDYCDGDGYLEGEANDDGVDRLAKFEAWLGRLRARQHIL